MKSLYYFLQLFLPVGVATIIPSPCTVVKYCLSHSKSIIARNGEGPRSITISFKIWKEPEEIKKKLIIIKSIRIFTSRKEIISLQ